MGHKVNKLSINEFILAHGLSFMTCLIQSHQNAVLNLVLLLLPILLNVIMRHMC